jgi:hypothetical protein
VDGYQREDGYYPEDAAVREDVAAEWAGRKAAVPGIAVAEAGQAVPGPLAQGAPAGVLQGAKAVVQDAPDGPVRTLQNRYFLPETGCLCVSFLTARWAV